MTSRNSLVAGLLLMGLAASARAEPGLFLPPQPVQTPTLPEATRIPLDSMPPQLREKVRSVVAQPSLSSKGPAVTFNTDLGTYHWLLEHPDLAVKLWRLKGAKVADIEQRGAAYRWDDEQGSEVLWHTALRSPGMHVWYAEGKVKPATLVPMTSFRAVAVMHYVEGKDLDGKPAIRHQVHFMLRCDSKAISLATRILGASVPRQVEQYLGQLQMFYGGMAWYLTHDEARARRMYRQIGLTVSEEATPTITPSSLTR
jgi:hypothetical protein